MIVPTVSIIVPVYNAEKYVRMLVDSILKQTFKDYELLLIDDGSSDKSAEILDDYANKDSRINVIHKENGGASSARNCGLDNAIGTFIAFADSDDYMFPDNLETMVKEVDGYDLLICHYCRPTRNEVIQGNVKRNEKKTWEISGGGDTMGETIQKIGYKNYIIWNQLFRRSIIEENHLRFERIESEDKLFSFEYFSRIASVKRIDYEGYCYFENLGSLGSTHKYIVETNWITKMEHIYERMETNYPPEQAFKNTVSWRIAHRLAVLCLKGYYQDSHKFRRERMKVWHDVRTDPWMQSRIRMHLIDRRDALVLCVAKYHLYPICDFIFNIYGKLSK